MTLYGSYLMTPVIYSSILTENKKIYTNTHICIHPSIHPSIHTHTYIRTYIHTYIHTYSFIHSFFLSFFHTFIYTHSFIHSFIHYAVIVILSLLDSSLSFSYDIIFHQILCRITSYSYYEVQPKKQLQMNRNTSGRERTFPMRKALPVYLLCFFALFVSSTVTVHTCNYTIYYNLFRRLCLNSEPILLYTLMCLICKQGLILSASVV
jgi:hypothetical protein